MKTLLLLRHAKSDWKATYSGDRNRPLSKRGVRATKLVGRYLADLGLEPDEILASPAQRAHDTARRVAEAAGWSCPVVVESRIYGGSAETVLDICRGRPDSTEALMLVGHQPIWSELAGRLIGGGLVDFPTAGVICLDAPIRAWSELRPGRATRRWMVTPRQLEESSAD